MITPPAPLPGARELFSLDPDLAYLNHGGFGAVPVTVSRERRRLIAEFDSNPTRFTLGMRPRVAAARDVLAEFCGADPAGSALVANATTGTALALHCLDLREGDEIVITDHGYAAVSLALEDMARRRGIRVVTAPVELDGEHSGAVEAVLASLTSRTRLVVVDQVSSATAQRQPVAQLAAELRARDVPLFVDGAHAPGMLTRPVAGLEADFWVGNLHKWAFAPPGTALLAVAPRWRERIIPLVGSHGLPDGFPTHIEEQGSHDYSPWLAAPSGVELFDRYGFARIQRHNVELARYGQQVVSAALGLTEKQLPGPGAEVSMRIVPLPVAVAPDTAAARELRARIAAKLGAEVAINLFRGVPYLRLSAQIYNLPEDYDRLAAGLAGLLAGEPASR